MNSPRDDVRRRVLVVEDDRDCAETMRLLLLACGYDVAVAHNGQQGLEGARRHEPHVVLCDIGLPDSDGYTVGSVLRQGGQAPRARLIALTGCADRSRALAAGFDQHLMKPVDPNVLLLELEAASDSRERKP